MQLTIEEAIQEQEKLSRLVVKADELPSIIEYIAGIDVAYEKEGDKTVAAVAVLNAKTLELIEVSIHEAKVEFPYVPGLFSFRELPPVLIALEKLKIKPDLIICDGQGLAHPRRFGLACHLGIKTGIPTIGCGKTRLIGDYKEPGEKRGSYSDLIDNEENIGRVLRTQDQKNPVFVSIGHKVSIQTATDWVLKISPNYRLPETTRAADHAVNAALKGFK